MRRNNDIDEVRVSTTFHQHCKDIKCTFQQEKCAQNSFHLEKFSAVQET